MIAVRILPALLLAGKKSFTGSQADLLSNSLLKPCRILDGIYILGGNLARKWIPLLSSYIGITARPKIRVRG